MVKKHQQFFNIIQVALDALSLLFAHFGAVLMKHSTGDISVIDSKHLFSTLWIIPLLLMVYYFMNVYSPMRSIPYRKEVLLITRAHLVGIVIFDTLLFFNKFLEYSREVSLLFAVFALIILLMERYAVRTVLRYLRKRGYNQKHMLIIGAGPLGLEFAGKIKEHQYFGYKLVGFLDDDEKKQDSTNIDNPVLGFCSRLSDLLENHTVDEVVVALPLNAYDKYSCIVDACEMAGVRIRIIPDYNKFLPGNPKIEDFDGMPLLNIRTIPMDDPLNKFLKRVFDIFISSIAIILTCPVMIAISIAIKLTSPGAVFFRQERVGLNNRPFNMLKFRSMLVDKDAVAATTWTTADDPRKTKLGSFIRKTSLDELPQFINVLLGSMSVVGPRPERPFFVQQFKKDIPKYMVKHQVKPGITGWAQVNGWRGDTSIEKRIECDIYYIENWDLLFDVKIMFLTVFKGLVNKNAY